MTDDVLDERIRALLGAVVASSPEPPAFPRHRLAAGADDGGIERPPVLELDPHPPTGHRPSHRVRFAVAVLGAAALVVLGVLLWNAGEEQGTPVTDDRITSDTTPVGVVHEVWTYAQAADLDCPDGVEVQGTFDTMTLESWADTQGTVRQDVTYPDGSTRSSISTVAPDGSFPVLQRGELDGRVHRCRHLATFLSEPGRQGPYRPVAPLGLGSDDPDERDRQPYEQVPGAHVDSRGRPAELWRWEQETQGMMWIGGGSGVRELLVEPGTDQLLEERVAIDTGYGPVSWDWVLTVREEVAVPRSTFSTEGFEQTTTTDGTVLPGSDDRGPGGRDETLCLATTVEV